MNNQNENSHITGDDIACPNCGGHKVRWVPYPKIEFGTMFIFWIIISLATIKGTIIIFAAGLVYWSIALVIRLKQNSRANLVNQMHCDTCGTDFELEKKIFSEKNHMQ